VQLRPRRSKINQPSGWPMAEEQAKKQSKAAHLKKHMWKPGQSGNPGGRPKGASLTNRLRKALDANDGKLAEIVVKVLLREGCSKGGAECDSPTSARPIHPGSRAGSRARAAQATCIRAGQSTRNAGYRGMWQTMTACLIMPQLSPELMSPTWLWQLAWALDGAEHGPCRVWFTVPPRHGKSELLLHDIARVLAKDPTSQLLYMTHTATFAAKQSKRARRLAKAAGVELAGDSNRAS